MALVELDRDVCYRALRTRDARFDGRFFTAVREHGYLLPADLPGAHPEDRELHLPAERRPLRIRWASGPCLRCRPEVAPGLAGWRGSANTVSRALGLIAEGGFDEGGADELANRLGIGARHLRRLFDRHVGASPVSVAQAHRILFAKKLITETALADDGDRARRRASAACVASTTSFQHTYGRAPSDLRRRSRRESDVGAGGRR